LAILLGVTSANSGADFDPPKAEAVGMVFAAD
jgi:hypothetical protein